MISIIAPLFVVAIEYSLNRLTLSFNHVFLQIIVACSYLATTALGQVLLAKPIYPNLLDWQMRNDNPGNLESPEFYIFVFSLIFGLMGTSLLVTALHKLKDAYWCCGNGKNVDINEHLIGTE